MPAPALINSDGTLKSKAELQAAFDAAGIDVKAPLATTCGSGVAASLLALAAGWHLTWRTPLALLMRDLLLPAVWLQAWFIDSFDWRGNRISEEVPLSQP